MSMTGTSERASAPAAGAATRVAVLGVHGGRVAPGAEHLLRDARLVVGGTRQLEALAPEGAERVAITADLEPAVAALDGCAGGACVLASGDPGFFGIVRVLRERLGGDRLDVHPAPSSVAVAFARVGTPWDDALVVSAHARRPEVALHAAMRHPKVAILTDRSAPPAWFARRLAGHRERMTVAERLGEPDERVVTAPPEELADLEAADPNVVLVWDDDAPSAGRSPMAPPRPGADAWALPESAFEHRAGMITKQEVRAVALARLGPGVGDLVWDVGCGSGSVAIEAARLGAAAIGVDHDPEAVAMSRRNAAAHAVRARFLEGAAPAILAGLPDPDGVFIGGGGADLAGVLDACTSRVRRAVVVTLAVVERAGPALDRLTAAGLEAEAVMVSGLRLRPMPGGHRLAPENPVIVVSGRRA